MKLSVSHQKLSSGIVQLYMLELLQKTEKACALSGREKYQYRMDDL